MNLLRTSYLLALLLFATTAWSQGTPLPDDEVGDDEEVEIVTTMEGQTAPNKRDQPSMWELGITPAVATLSSDVDASFGYGGSIHLRKAFDHIFSLRLDGAYANLNGDNETGNPNTNRRFEADWLSGTAYAVITLNNFNFQGDTRNVNVYVMAGAGGNFFSTEFQCTGREARGEGSRFGCPGGDTGLPFDPGSGRNGEVDRAFRTHGAFGAGINFRLNERVNIGAEYQGFGSLGNRADVIDGYDIGDFRDIINMVGLNLNINLGNSDNRTEPRYWTNAFTPIKEDVAALNRRVDAATMDSDGDGIVDGVDQEADTPTGVPVDSRGRTLDSDNDGVPDYRDLEPFFPPRQGEQINADGVVMERIDAPMTDDEIQTLVDSSVARALRENNTMLRTQTGAVYMPMIYFALNQSRIPYDDWGTLASVARMLDANPDMRIIVRGYTDQTGSMEYNQRLSYQRANNVVQHLVEQHDIARDRLVLQYRGQEDDIVPLDMSRVDRRVEFLNAPDGAQEDSAPDGMQSDMNTDMDMDDDNDDD